MIHTQRHFRRNRSGAAQISLCTAVLLLVAACGGGGGGDAPPVTPDPTPSKALVWGTGTWGSNQWSASSSPVELAPSNRPSSTTTDSELLNTVITR
ncbi:MAG: hypothetical protein ACI85K_002723 [Hyphomicrobiaceae bacterium]|jgi:hypothetical protein